MKTFQEFLSEDAASDTQATIAGDDTGGSSDTFGRGVDTSFKKRPKTGLGKYLVDKFKNRDKNKPENQKPDGPGKQKDRKPQTYRQANKPASPRPEKGGPLAKRPTPSSGSMVQKKTAASKQPPQHKQISARPASTAMAGSRQRPAIRPAKKVNVQDL